MATMEASSETMGFKWLGCPANLKSHDGFLEQILPSASWTQVKLERNKVLSCMSHCTGGGSCGGGSFYNSCSTITLRSVAQKHLEYKTSVYLNILLTKEETLVWRERSFEHRGKFLPLINNYKVRFN